MIEQDSYLMSVTYIAQCFNYRLKISLCHGVNKTLIYHVQQNFVVFVSSTDGMERNS